MKKVLSDYQNEQCLSLRCNVLRVLNASVVSDSSLTSSRSSSAVGGRWLVGHARSTPRGQQHYQMYVGRLGEKGPLASAVRQPLTGLASPQAHGWLQTASRHDARRHPEPHRQTIVQVHQRVDRRNPATLGETTQQSLGRRSVAGRVGAGGPEQAANGGDHWLGGVDARRHSSQLLPGTRCLDRSVLLELQLGPGQRPARQRVLHPEDHARSVDRPAFAGAFMAARSRTTWPW